MLAHDLVCVPCISSSGGQNDSAEDPVLLFFALRLQLHQPELGWWSRYPSWKNGRNRRYYGFATAPGTKVSGTMSARNSCAIAFRPLFSRAEKVQCGSTIASWALTFREIYFPWRKMCHVIVTMTDDKALRFFAKKPACGRAVGAHQELTKILDSVCRSRNAFQTLWQTSCAWVFQVPDVLHDHHYCTVLCIWGAAEVECRRHIGVEVHFCWRLASSVVTAVYTPVGIADSFRK